MARLLAAEEREGAREGCHCRTEMGPWWGVGRREKIGGGGGVVVVVAVAAISVDDDVDIGIDDIGVFCSGAGSGSGSPSPAVVLLRIELSDIPDMKQSRTRGFSI